MRLLGVPEGVPGPPDCDRGTPRSAISAYTALSGRLSRPREQRRRVEGGDVRPHRTIFPLSESCYPVIALHDIRLFSAHPGAFRRDSKSAMISLPKRVKLMALTRRSLRAGVLRAVTGLFVFSGAQGRLPACQRC